MRVLTSGPAPPRLAAPRRSAPGAFCGRFFVFLFSGFGRAVSWSLSAVLFQVLRFT